MLTRFVTALIPIVCVQMSVQLLKTAASGNITAEERATIALYESRGIAPEKAAMMIMVDRMVAADPALAEAIFKQAMATADQREEAKKAAAAKK